MDWNGIPRDLSLNLIAEFVGIVATVFWVDRRIKKREVEQELARWKPATNLTYSRLYNLFNKFLSKILGYEFASIHNFIYFGDVSCTATIDLSNPTVNSLYFHIEETYKKKLERRALYKKYSTDTDDCVIDTSLYENLRNEIVNILNISSESIDPELRSNLLGIDDKLMEFIASCKGEIDEMTHLHVGFLLEDMVKIMTKLKKNSTKELTSDELLNQIRNNIQQRKTE